MPDQREGERGKMVEYIGSFLLLMLLRSGWKGRGLSEWTSWAENTTITERTQDSGLLQATVDLAVKFQVSRG